MPRKQKKYHYIYKTTCQITGKFYIGMHSTDNLEDSYLGSGKILGYSISKHGKENHKKEILEFCSSREELKQREKVIINEDLLKEPLNINLKYGGEGGGKFYSKQQINASIAGNKSPKRNHAASSAKAIETKTKNNSFYRNGKFSQKAIERLYSKDTILKRQETFKKNNHQQGSKNSQFGTCWIKDNIKSIKIKKELLQEYLDKGYSKGRKIKFI